MSQVSQLLVSLAVHVYGSATPILLVTGALLALISQRNQHISDRKRANDAEMGYSISNIKDFETRLSRFNSLKSQNVLFTARYETLCLAFLLTSAALILFVITSLMTYYARDYPRVASIRQDHVVSHHWNYVLLFAGILACVAFTLSIVGTALIWTEFLSGPKTLAMNSFEHEPQEKEKGPEP